jgi:hypothetical protein
MIGFKVNNLQLFAAHIGSLALPRAQFCWLYMVVHGCTWSAEWAWAPFLVPLDGRKSHGMPWQIEAEVQKSWTTIPPMAPGNDFPVLGSQ